MLRSDCFAFPANNWRAKAADLLANSRFLRGLRRSIMSRLPFPALMSDVEDVVYANWVVPASALAALVPPEIKLAERDGQVILTVLTYRHGHFGLRFFRRFRRVFPSPLQSNWRVYVAAVGSNALTSPTVFFLANIFDSALYVLTTRLFSDALPSHLAAHFDHRMMGEVHRSTIDGGNGSAPSFQLTTRPAERPALPDSFAGWFDSIESAYVGICLQDAAICKVEDIGALAEAKIYLPIKIEEVQALETVSCEPGELLTSLGAIGKPWCFRLPAAEFAVIAERILS